jgi:hypothetical protein
MYVYLRLFGRQLNNYITKLVVKSSGPIFIRQSPLKRFSFSLMDNVVPASGWFR